VRHNFEKFIEMEIILEAQRVSGRVKASELYLFKSLIK
jgi:hypothetical protein